MEDWVVPGSQHAMNTRNLIKETMSDLSLPSEFPKTTFNLAIGDPTKFPEFSAHPVLIEAVKEQLESYTGNGYVDAEGPREAREALAAKFSYENIQLTWQDVVIDIGACGAMHTTLQAFLDAGDNILIPAPGYPGFKTMAWNIGADCKTYALKPDQNWEIDFQDLDRQIDERTKLLVVVNPSNPCGTVFSKEHLLEILDWARRHKIVVFADEVYHGMVYGREHFPMGSLTDEVPVVSVTALSKPFLVPGWRCGWILIYDKYKRLTQVREAINRIKYMLLHPPPFIANALPRILSEIPEDYMPNMMGKIKKRAELVYSKVESIQGLSMDMPQGAFYCMVKIDLSKFQRIETSMDFAKKLANEHGVLVIPCEIFMASDAFRVNLCHTEEALAESMDRIQEFVQAYSK